jgi:hypothetical protein
MNHPVALRCRVRETATPLKPEMPADLFPHGLAAQRRLGVPRISTMRFDMASPSRSEAEESVPPAGLVIDNREVVDSYAAVKDRWRRVRAHHKIFHG